MRVLSILLLFSSAFSQTLVLRHVTVIDTSNPSPRPDQTVTIKDGWIAEVGADLPIPKRAQVIDAAGKFLIPGLWDMHTHVAGISADPQWGKMLLLQYLSYGITSIRDMAGDVDTLLAWKREQAEGRLEGPRMLVAGPFIDGSKQGFDHPGDVVEAATPDAGRDAVRLLKKRGVDFIKVGSQLSRATFFAIADECKRQQISFSGHVPNSVTPREASAAGMKSQEHLFGIALSISSEEQKLRDQIASARAHQDSNAYSSAVSESQDTLDEEKARNLFQAFNRNGTWIVATLAWTQITSTLSQRTDSPELRRLPPALQEKWAPGKPISSAAAEAYYSCKLKSDLRIVNLMRRSKVRLLAGSDSLDPYVFPGDSLHHELEMLVKAGLSPLEALRSATLSPAEFFGLENELGTIAKGKRADLLLLDASPLENIGNTRRISAIIQKGRLLTQPDLLGHAVELRNSSNVMDAQ
jgi:imidazolonepropionase-like amidohydrolase